MGQRLSEHPDVRKLGFTGSTPIGKQIMKRYRPDARPPRAATDFPFLFFLFIAAAPSVT